MAMETALRARLVADASVAALVGTRVYWRIRPQGSDLPAIVLTIISDPRPQHLEGFQDLRATRVQIDCMAATFAELVALREAAIAAVVPAGVTDDTRFCRGEINNVIPKGEDTATAWVFGEAIDATIWHKQAE